jgi:hypothetical protein
MAHRECARCHSFFESVGLEAVCPICLPLEENEFRRIKEYLSIHQGASSSEVMNELKVSLKSIRRYLKEDRLEIVGENRGFLRCELCGTLINSGRFCELCYKEGQARLRNDAGLGLKGSYARPLDNQKTPSKKGIQYSENKDKKG